MNDKNLIRAEDLTSEELRKRAEKGGKASGLARKRKKLLRELVENFGTLEVFPKEKAAMASLGIDEKNMSRDMQIVVSLYKKAMNGDVAAFNAIRDIKGEKPDNNVNLNIPSSVRIEIVDSEYNADFASSEEEVDRSR